jgi:hypothetical protein
MNTTRITKSKDNTFINPKDKSNPNSTRSESKSYLMSLIKLYMNKSKMDKVIQRNPRLRDMLIPQYKLKQTNKTQSLKFLKRVSPEPYERRQGKSLTRFMGKLPALSSIKQTKTKTFIKQKTSFHFPSKPSKFGNRISFNLDDDILHFNPGSSGLLNKEDDEFEPIAKTHRPTTGFVMGGRRSSINTISSLNSSSNKIIVNQCTNQSVRSSRTSRSILGGAHTHHVVGDMNSSISHHTGESYNTITVAGGGKTGIAHSAYTVPNLNTIANTNTIANLNTLANTIGTNTTGANNNIINIVNNLTRNTPSDIFKVKINSYDINIISSHEDIDFKLEEGDLDNDNVSIFDSLAEKSNDHSEKDIKRVEGNIKLKSSKTFNISPKIQIDIHRPLQKTLSLRIDGHNISLSKTTINNETKKSVAFANNDEILNLTSREGSRVLSKQNTKELTFKSFLDANSGTNSPVRQSIMRSSTVIDNAGSNTPDVNNTKMKKVSLYLASNIEELDDDEILQKSVENLDIETYMGFKRGISVKLTTNSKNETVNNNMNINYLSSSDDASSAQLSGEIKIVDNLEYVPIDGLVSVVNDGYDSDDDIDKIRETVKRILYRVGDCIEDDDLALRESKLYSSTFVRHVNRSSTMLKNILFRESELRRSSVRKGISKSLIVQKSDLIPLDEEEIITRRTNSQTRLGRTMIDLHSHMLKVNLDRYEDEDKLINFHKLMNIEFKLIEITSMKEIIIKESRESSLRYIKSLIEKEFQSIGKMVKNKKLIDFYRVGFRRRLFDDILPIPELFLPYVKLEKLDIENISTISTGIQVINHINNTYLNVYDDILDAVFKGAFQFEAEIVPSDRLTLKDHYRVVTGRYKSPSLLSIQTPIHQAFEGHSMRSSRRSSNPFLGPENNEFINRYVHKDNPNDKGDEDYFLRYGTDDDSGDEYYMYGRKMTHHSIKSDVYFIDYIKELKVTNRATPKRKTRRDRRNDLTDGEREKLLNFKPKRIRKTDAGERKATHVTKPRFKLVDMEEVDDENKPIYILKGKHDASYVINKRLKSNKYGIII